MTSLKIALVQKSAAPNQRKENHRRMLEYIKQAAAMGADLVLFPEMWSNGYAPPFP